MMATKVEDVDIDDSSLDNSADGEYLGGVDESSFGSPEGKSGLVTQSLDNQEDTSTHYHIRDISAPVTYKIVQMPNGDNVCMSSPGHVIAPEGEYYVIGNPVEVFGTTGTQKKKEKNNTMQVKAATAKKRDDKRRATHNEVERRRRDKINSWITKLAALVPNSGLPDSASKGGILAKACDYIGELTDKNKRLEKVEEDNEKLVLEILRLNQELIEVRKENSTMRNQLADNCIVLNHRPKGQKS